MELNQFYFKLPELKTDPIIDDSTLRDGIQMPGLAVGPKDATRIAQLLNEIGVERIELFHYQEPDKQAAKLILDQKLDMRIAAWCRAVKEDIDSAVQLGFNEVGISHPVSDMHFQAKWPEKTREQILANLIDVTEYAAKTCGLRTFVHGEDSTRADWNFESRLISSVAEAGAECYRVCDTVGIGLSSPDAPLPSGIPAKIVAIKKETKIKDIEIHAHDDFGNALENTMAAIKAAQGVWDKIYASTTYLGIGERAGNAKTEKVLLNLYLHYGVRKFEGKTAKLKQTADYISNATGFHLPPNTAIVGDYGFAHESGIHTHGVLSNPWTYEPYPPELVGNQRRLTIGKQSGKGIIKHKITEITGTEPDDQNVAIVVEKIKDIYANGRRASLNDVEFKKVLYDLKIIK
ncbi:MAG: isopropylmalate synthase [Candidatus Bathyarchaeota archaeon]|uniref:homocitrate synthase/isopropylmalate synthase family protein n=1 Tax=Candidatus Bathycorpusculum sp. TaxID=2994959 RepID=UPI0028338287|nr:isopropylmalate synthase [Candidatus Termiticorpusculum sp.]MCL2292824.1 isopropylmalate synthase [Candidatus Termiticorpusculum sp.]